MNRVTQGVSCKASCRSESGRMPTLQTVPPMKPSEVVTSAAAPHSRGTGNGDATRSWSVSSVLHSPRRSRPRIGLVEDGCKFAAAKRKPTGS